MDINKTVILRIESACKAAESPSGMSVHDGIAKVHAADLRYLLKAVSALQDQTQPNIVIFTP